MASTNSQKVVLVLLSVVLCLCLAQLTATLVFVCGSCKAHKAMRHPHKLDARTEKAEQPTEDTVAAMAAEIERMLEEIHKKEDYTITLPPVTVEGQVSVEKAPKDLKLELTDSLRRGYQARGGWGR